MSMCNKREYIISLLFTFIYLIGFLISENFKNSAVDLNSILAITSLIMVILSETMISFPKKHFIFSIVSCSTIIFYLVVGVIRLANIDNPLSVWSEDMKYAECFQLNLLHILLSGILLVFNINNNEFELTNKIKIIKALSLFISVLFLLLSSLYFILLLMIIVTEHIWIGILLLTCKLLYFFSAIVAISISGKLIRNKKTTPISNKIVHIYCFIISIDYVLEEIIRWFCITQYNNFNSILFQFDMIILLFYTIDMIIFILLRNCIKKSL